MLAGSILAGQFRHAGCLRECRGSARDACATHPGGRLSIGLRSLVEGR